MRIAIRVDASGQIGTGHLMRCLTLADALQQRGARSRFISRHMPEHLRDMLAAKGHEFILLESGAALARTDGLTHAHWLGTSQKADAQEAKEALSDQPWDWLIVDHYALDARWESALRQIANNILVIDDIADRRHDCDLLIDQNFYADMETQYAGKVPSHCQPLLGPRYALLREEFRLLRHHVKSRSGPVKRVLIFFGGVDATNYTMLAMDVLVRIGTSDLHVDVVIGAQHPFRKEIEAACAVHEFACHFQTDRMAQLMGMADLAIGAGGTATWERCCLGLPTLSICTADNQRKQIAHAASVGLLHTLEVTDAMNLTFERHVRTLIESDHLRHFISSSAMQTVDGRGTLRVIAHMGCSGVEIRKARHDDSKDVFEWRNHPSVIAASLNAELIEWEDHQKWFASVLSAADRVLLIAERAGSAVGVVRFDVRGDEAEVSIYLVPGIQQAGQGSDVLRGAERWLGVNRPKVRLLSALVLGGNETSRRLFLSAGYRVRSTSFVKTLH